MNKNKHQEVRMAWTREFAEERISASIPMPSRATQLLKMAKKIAMQLTEESEHTVTKAEALAVLASENF